MCTRKDYTYKERTKRQNLLTLLLYSSKEFTIHYHSGIHYHSWEMQCALSHPIPWDISHVNPIPMGKPEIQTSNFFFNTTYWLTNFPMITLGWLLKQAAVQLVGL